MHITGYVYCGYIAKRRHPYSSTEVMKNYRLTRFNFVTKHSLAIDN